jgi:hypothetical protein
MAKNWSTVHFQSGWKKVHIVLYTLLWFVSLFFKPNAWFLFRIRVLLFNKTKKSPVLLSSDTPIHPATLLRPINEKWVILLQEKGSLNDQQRAEYCSDCCCWNSSFPCTCARYTTNKRCVTSQKNEDLIYTGGGGKLEISYFLWIKIYKCIYSVAQKWPDTRTVVSSIKWLLRHSVYIKVKVSRYRPKQALGDLEG